MPRGCCAFALRTVFPLVPGIDQDVNAAETPSDKEQQAGSSRWFWLRWPGGCLHRLRFSLRPIRRSLLSLAFPWRKRSDRGFVGFTVAARQTREVPDLQDLVRSSRGQEPPARRKRESHSWSVSFPRPFPVISVTAMEATHASSLTGHRYQFSVRREFHLADFAENREFTSQVQRCRPG